MGARGPGGGPPVVAPRHRAREGGEDGGHTAPRGREQSRPVARDPPAPGRIDGPPPAHRPPRARAPPDAGPRSLERMRARRQKILDDPEAYRREQIERRIPDDFEDLTEEEQQRIVGHLEAEVLSADPAVLREEIARLTRLIDQARTLEG